MASRIIVKHGNARKNLFGKAVYLCLTELKNCDDQTLEVFENEQKWRSAYQDNNIKDDNASIQSCNASVGSTNSSLGRSSSHSSSHGLSHSVSSGAKCRIRLNELFHVSFLHREVKRLSSASGITIFRRPSHRPVNKEQPTGESQILGLWCQNQRSLVFTFSSVDEAVVWRRSLLSAIQCNRERTGFPILEHVWPMTLKIKRTSTDGAAPSVGGGQGAMFLCLTEQELLLVHRDARNPEAAVHYQFVRQCGARPDGVFELHLGWASPLGECQLFMRLADGREARSVQLECISLMEKRRRSGKFGTFECASSRRQSARSNALFGGNGPPLPRPQVTSKGCETKASLRSLPQREQSLQLLDSCGRRHQSLDGLLPIQLLASLDRMGLSQRAISPMPTEVPRAASQSQNPGTGETLVPLVEAAEQRTLEAGSNGGYLEVDAAFMPKTCMDRAEILRKPAVGESKLEQDALTILLADQEATSPDGFAASEDVSKMLPSNAPSKETILWVLSFLMTRNLKVGPAEDSGNNSMSDRATELSIGEQMSPLVLQLASKRAFSWGAQSDVAAMTCAMSASDAQPQDSVTRDDSTGEGTCRPAKRMTIASCSNRAEVGQLKGVACRLLDRSGSKSSFSEMVTTSSGSSAADLTSNRADNQLFADVSFQPVTSSGRQESRFRFRTASDAATSFRFVGWPFASRRLRNSGKQLTTPTLDEDRQRTFSFTSQTGRLKTRLHRTFATARSKLGPLVTQKLSASPSMEASVNTAVEEEEEESSNHPIYHYDGETGRPPFDPMLEWMCRGAKGDRATVASKGFPAPLDSNTFDMTDYYAPVPNAQL